MDKEAIAAYYSRVHNRPVLESDKDVKEFISLSRSSPEKGISRREFLDFFMNKAKQGEHPSKRLIQKHIKAHHVRKDLV